MVVVYAGETWVHEIFVKSIPKDVLNEIGIFYKYIRWVVKYGKCENTKER